MSSVVRVGDLYIEPINKGVAIRVVEGNRTVETSIFGYDVHSAVKVLAGVLLDFFKYELDRLNSDRIYFEKWRSDYAEKLQSGRDTEFCKSKFEEYDKSLNRTLAEIKKVEALIKIYKRLLKS